MSINYTTRDNAYYRNLNIYDGRSGLIGKFEGETSSYIAGSGTQYQTQLLGNQINGSPYYNNATELAINYNTYTRRSIMEHEIINHGPHYPQYFYGCGTYGSAFENVVTGCGMDAKEAYEDLDDDGRLEFLEWVKQKSES